MTGLSVYGFAAALMLLSAALHAVVGALLKLSNDKIAFRAALSLTSALILLPFAFILPFPPRDSWMFLGFGVCMHFAYQLTMVGAFSKGDMSLVYPVMRGVAPALAALFAFVILRETLNAPQTTGLIISVAALICFGWPQGRVSPAEHNDWRAAITLALICGIMIALYSVLDAGGVRITKTELGSVWPYIVWLFLLDTIGMTGLVAARHKSALGSALWRQARAALPAGILSLIGFSSALYAFSLAPVAQMSALRETSIVFGAVLAHTILKEPFGRRRIIFACILSAGLMLLQFG